MTASTIVNDDSTSFSIAGASVTEGTGGNTTLNFVVSLSAPAKDPVSVQYATVNGSALAPADYTAASGTCSGPETCARARSGGTQTRTRCRACPRCETRTRDTSGGTS